MTATATAKQRKTMTQINLTEREAKKVPFGSGTYLDQTMRGFMLVNNAVSKSYVFQRKIKGRSIRITLGRVGEITAEEARDAAMAAWLQMKQGINPNEQKRENRVRGMTLRGAFSLFMSSEPRSPKTIQLYQASFDRHLVRWADRTMEDIGNDRTGVRKLHEITTAAARSGLAKQKVKCGKAVPEHAGQATANNVMRLLKGIYNRARVEVPSLPEDPTINVNWHKDRVRNTSLSVNELKGWFAKVEALQNSIKRDYWISVILTGGRRSQIAESEWEHIDFKNATWHFPKPKGGTERAYTVPVSKYLLGRVQGRREQNHELYLDSKWVFPSEKSRSRHLSIPRNDKQGLPLAHALRHTYRTHSLIAGVSDIESHLLMNHKPEGVNYDYISRTVTIEHLRGAQEKITAHFLKHFGCRQTKMVRIGAKPFRPAVLPEVPKG